MQFALSVPRYPRCSSHLRPAAAFRSNSCRAAPRRARSGDKPRASSSGFDNNRVVPSDGGSEGGAGPPVTSPSIASAATITSSSTGQAAGGAPATISNDMSSGTASSPSSSSRSGLGTNSSSPSTSSEEGTQQQDPPADSEASGSTVQAGQEDAAAAALALQELQEAWQDLTTTVSSMFIPTSSRSSNSSNSSSSEAAGDTPTSSSSSSNSSRAQSLPPLPQVLGRLFSGRFLSEARQLEQQWQDRRSTQWPASTAAATGRGSGDGDDGVFRNRAPTTTTTTGSRSSSSNQRFVDVPASQQVIDVEVDSQPPTPPPSSSSGGGAAGSETATAAAAADPWLQTPTQTAPEPAAADAAVTPEEEDAEAVPPGSQLLLLPGTNILKYTVWGVWVASWLTVLPAVAAAVQVGELGRVCWAMLLSYPGISPLVTHLAADAGRLAAGHWGGLVGSCLLHSGLLSVVACAAGIQDAGEELEPVLGMYQLLLLFLMAGVGGAVAHYRCGGGTVLLSGAGAVAGLYGGWLALAVSTGGEELPFGSNLGYLLLLALLALGAWQPAVGEWSVVGGFFTGAVGVFAVPHLAAGLAWALYVPMVMGLLLLRLAWSLVGVVFTSAVLLVLSTIQAVKEFVATIRNL